MFIDQNAFVSQQQYDQMISMIFQKYRVELVFLVGYNKILSNFFIKDWTNKIFNIHPSLLPEFSGLFDRSIYRAVLKKEVKKLAAPFIGLVRLLIAEKFYCKNVVVLSQMIV